MSKAVSNSAGKPASQAASQPAGRPAGDRAASNMGADEVAKGVFAADTRLMLLLDTNVLLDYYLAMRAGHDAAVSLITTAFKRDIPMICAATSLKDFYYIYCLQVKRSSSEHEAKGASFGAASGGNDTAEAKRFSATASSLAWACIDNLLKIASIASMGDGDAAVAAKMRRLHEDFEDDFILATAMRCNATHLVTADKVLRAHSTIPAFTCEEMLALLT